MAENQKKITALWVACLISIGMSGYLMFTKFHHDVPKVVYIDNNVLLEKYQGMIEAKNEFEKTSAQWQANVDTLSKELEGEIKGYEKERGQMTAKERSLKEELINHKQNQFYQYREAMKKKYKDEEEKMTAAVLQKVNGYITDYGKRNNYTIILGANNSGNVVYAQEALDITVPVLDYINKMYAGK
jgi:outer membrane protein